MDNKINKKHSNKSEDFDVFQAIGEFEREIGSDGVRNFWRNSGFFENPLSFFTGENFQKIKEVPSGRRLAILAKAAEHMSVSPILAAEYFKIFPEDLKVIKTIFCDIRHGRPQTAGEFNLFSIVAPEIERVSDNFPYGSTRYDYKKEDFFPHNQFLEIAERRAALPESLLEGGKYYGPQDFDRLSKKASDSFFSAMSEAVNLNIDGSHKMDASNLFKEGFADLSEENRSEILRMALVDVHNISAFDEAMNSAFTKEMVENDRERVIKSLASEGRAFHNIAHSIIFKTFQASSIYDLSEDYFEYEMNSTAEIGGAAEEYADHRIILEILARISELKQGHRELCLTLVDFWNKNRNPIFGNRLVEALNALDPESAAAELQRLILEERGDKNHLSAVLYRLEFGQIGISEKGVKYLERMYDLGELNRPDYFVQRLTARGDVGIFDDQRVLRKYFNLGNLASGEKRIKPVVQDFIYETLFTPKSGETEKERLEREGYLKEFKESYFDFYDSDFSEQTGIKVNNLDFKEQGWFLAYFKHSDENTRKRLMNFAKIFGENGLKTFLACEYSMDSGEQLLFLGDSLPLELSSRIFVKYGEIVSEADRVAAMIKNFNKEENPEMEEKIRESLLKRAKDMLLLFYNEATTGKTIDDIEAKLDGIRADIILFAATFKAVYQSEEGIDLGEVKQISLETKSPAEISPADQESMILMAKRNYADTPELADKYVIPPLVRALSDEKKKEDSIFYLLKKDGVVISFFRLEKVGDEVVHFGSFNTDQNAQGSNIGKEVLKLGLDAAASESLIEADCDASARISEYYINSVGFVATELIENATGTGQNVFHIIRDDRRAKKLSRQPNFQARDWQEFVDYAKERFTAGFVLTYIERDSQGSGYKCSFEKLAGTEEMQEAA